MAKKRTLADLIRDEVEQQSLLNNDAHRDEPRPDWVMNSCSGATLKTPAPEQKHWVEIYTGSKRKAYYYYRYVWMEGRKLHHVHISGAASSLKAKSTKEKVDRAIALGNSPTEIITLIQSEKLLAVAVVPRQTSP